MKTRSTPASALGICGLALFSLTVITLFIMALLAGRGHYHRLLLAKPVRSYAPALINLDAIEQFCEDEFLLTYEQRDLSSASTVYQQCQVTLVGTNSLYPALLGYQVLSGAFFTKAAWNAKSRHAVLNETAAFTLFGSNKIVGKTIKLDKEIWLVSGVLYDDDDENNVIYIPSINNAQSAHASAIIALLAPEQGISETYAKNALKVLGVQDATYIFVNMENMANLYWEWLFAALKLTLCVLFGLFTSVMLRYIKAAVLVFMDTLKQQYLKDSLVMSWKELLRIIALVIFLLAGIVFCLTLVLQVLTGFLYWHSLPWNNEDFRSAILKADPSLLYEL
ncbi:MAG: ABC transporter permease [Treponema sp.]|nr:ABC transporter permease [Treponema sp.]